MKGQHVNCLSLVSCRGYERQRFVFVGAAVKVDPSANRKVLHVKHGRIETPSPVLKANEPGSSLP